MPNTFDVLQKVIEEAKAFPNWKFFMRWEDGAPRLVIQISTTHNYDHNIPFTVNHFHPAPVTTYNEKSWRRWVYDQCVRTMNHEIGEALNFNGERPFAPMHGPGEDPYTVHEIRPESDALTTQYGTMRAPPV